MKLSYLLSDAGKSAQFVYNGGDAEISGITDDTRTAAPGNIFVCVKGASFDGHDAAAQMLENGAAAVVCGYDLGLGSSQIIVEDTRRFYGLLAAAWFGHPERKMKLIGVTGTNGKTTITTIIHHILNENGLKTALIGTAGTLIGNEEIKRDDSTPTTPKVYELYFLLSLMAEKGCQCVVMEVSSFALDQNRIGPANFSNAVFTNLTQDHLDYHGDMESYYQAKKLLFTEHCDTAFINTEDEYGARLINEISCEKYSYGVMGGTSVYAGDIRPTAGGSKFWFNMPGKSVPFSLRMVGSYNVSNAVAAVAVCLRMGIPIERIMKSVAGFKGVRGRCEIIPTGRNFMVVCDYAHSPDALENVLKGIRWNVEGRLICLFGCGGDRDRTKRPLMAKAAAAFADYLIVTSDNPRGEDPDAIIDEIMTGIDDPLKPCDRITDRREAIFHAVRIAQKGDVVVLAGKGHEDYQILRNNVHIHFDEREVVADALKATAQHGSESAGAAPAKMTLWEICEAVGGKPYDIGDSQLTVSAADISSDTRTIGKGGLFFAIKGERFDGHDYVPTAAEKGAAAAITEKLIPGFPCIVVNSTRKALLDLAGAYRRKFNPILVGVTGSTGKTTTKEMTALALSSCHNTLKTDGNRNNEIGMPFTLFGLTAAHTAAVIEMGMSGFGEIERLSNTCAPDICIITNIGCSHMEKLGSREGILQAKLEILSGAKPDAPLIVSGDDDMLLPLAENQAVGSHRVIACSVRKEGCEYQAKNIMSDSDHISFDVYHNGTAEQRITLPCPGMHNVIDALFAYAAAAYAGCESDVIVSRLKEFRTDGLRQNIEHKYGLTVIADCYNAAPDSMKAAIDMLCEIKPEDGGRHICVLGDMLELGDTSPELHKQVGRYAAEKGVDQLFCYGELAKDIAKGAESSGLHSGCSLDKATVLNFLRFRVKKGDVILFKASRSMHLEEVMNDYFKLLEEKNGNEPT